jgi:hypothetical protein
LNHFHPSLATNITFSPPESRDFFRVSENFYGVKSLRPKK